MLDQYCLFEHLFPATARHLQAEPTGMASRLLRAVVGPVFHEIANSMVDAFCKRAASLYGARHG